MLRRSDSGFAISMSSAGSNIKFSIKISLVSLVVVSSRADEVRFPVKRQPYKAKKKVLLYTVVRHAT